MREILFRGERESDGKWIYGYYSDDKVYNTDFPCIFPLVECEDDADWAVLPETVGQFTGLVDKNGRKIFEGDIVKYGDTLHKVVFENRFGNAYFGIVMDNRNEVWSFSHLAPADKMLVIGNIFDNPELIRGVEE